MENLRIVEYDSSYAKAIADMWNKSGENWGGLSIVYTEENIIKEHNGAAHLNVYLALEGEEVVGYCSFSKYAEDEGALYIPLLNARTDCHGKGVGKALVLTTVKRTMELGWSRLDLYTWPGNTKAVPLYKKCGFFWERRDDTTHLINLIPYVMQTEAVEDFFKTADWYKDSKRVIAIEPDGIRENEFDYFEYLWEKDGRNLRMQFERRGRGLRLIETDDYLIKATVEDLNLVFGKSYKVYYDILNKSGRPLEISIKGVNNKNIAFSMDSTAVINDSARIEGDFFVGKIEEEQSEWRTHPVVEAIVAVNGRRAHFKTGVVPKYPAKLSMVVPGDKGKKNNDTVFYLDIESNLKSNAVFELELPDSDDISLVKKVFSIEMKPLERKSIEIPYKLKNYCFYSANTKITAIIGDEKICFDKELSAVFKGYSGILWGETEEYWAVANGDYIAKLHKFDNELTLSNGTPDEYPTFIMYPKLGQPFSTEFSRKRPYKVSFLHEGNSISMYAHYMSEDFRDIELISVSKLYSSGLLEQHYEVVNKSTESSKELWLNANVYNELHRAVLPYNGKYVEFNNSFYGLLDFWDLEKLSEHWMFSKGNRISSGLSWGKNTKAVFEIWFLRLENRIGILDSGETKKTEPILWTHGMFNDWKDFRRFVTEEDTDTIFATDHADFIVNEGNPFVEESFKVKYLERRVAYLNGEVTLYLHSDDSMASKKISEEQKLSEVMFDINIQAKKPDIINLRVDFEDIEFEKNKLVFVKGKDTVKTSIIKENSMDVHTADNGVIRIKAAEGFANSIYSLVYNNNEWIHTSFPTPVPKSWFNPWTGGIEVRPQKFLPASAHRETRKAEFIEHEDNAGNMWKGIKTSLIINENKDYKGLTINQYFLLLPDVPVMCYTSEFVQNTGKCIDDVEYYNFAYLKSAEDAKNSWVVMTDGKGQRIRHKCGKLRQDIQTSTYIQYGSSERKDKMSVVTDVKEGFQIAFTNNEIISNLCIGRLSCKDKNNIFTRPVFYILGEEEYKYTDMEDLLKIYFK
ncbi:MAG: GNAT family N-acetyltransferase [Bacillota bacterium]